jgi:hypothetical protein
MRAIPPPCVCGHGEAFHNLSTDKSRRTACSVTEGRTAVPCGCRRYEPKEATP